jgi:polysaccharide pyruvyl transferase WcaK-like protein
MQIVLVNVTSDSNRGSCALTWASLGFIFEAFPQASVAIVPVAVTPPEVDPFRHTRRRYPNVAILPPLFDGEGKSTGGLLWRLAKSLAGVFRFGRRRQTRNTTLEWIRNSDLAVSVGGVNFETLGGTLRDDARFLVRSLPLLAAQKIGVPSVFVGAQIGPFRSRLGRALFRRCASRAAVVFPRDRVSEAEVQRQVAHRRSVLLPDSAFALNIERRAPGAGFDRHGVDANAATLALVVSSALRSEERHDTHVALFAHVAKRLVASGLFAQIIVVVQCDEDRPISLELARSLELDPRFVIDDDRDPDQLSNLYAACRLVISSRLHALILAMLGGAPVISLAPEVTFKEHAVLDLLGLESFCVPTRIGPERAAEICLALASDADRHRSAMAALSAAREQLSEVPLHLREVARKAHS